MAKYKITHDRANCIGCAACAAVAPDHWEMKDDGKSSIVGGKEREDGWEELDIDQESLAENKEAAESCPVNVIHIKELDNDEEII